MANPYLERLTKRYNELVSGIEGLQTRAAEAERDLTEDEYRSVTAQGEEAKKLGEQIKDLTEIETRSAEVGKLAATIQDGVEQQQRAGQFTTQTRDPGHYRAEKDGGELSFFTDHFRATKLGDPTAQQRLREFHQFRGFRADAQTRAVTQASGGSGTVLPKWLVDEYAALARAQRVVANKVRNVDMGTDPRPMHMGKQTGGVDANITDQTTEGENNDEWGTDAFTTGSDVLTPTERSVFQDVSRQFFYSGTPGTDKLVVEDVMGAWNAKVETLVCAKIAQAATNSGIVFATEAAFQDVTAGVSAAIDAVIDAQTAVAADKRGMADLAWMNSRRFGAFRKLHDTVGRKLMPVERYNPVNAAGAMGNGLVGDIEGTDAFLSFGADQTTYPEKFFVMRAYAVYLGEGSRYDFQYDQVVGPSAIRVGTWGSVGVLVRWAAEVQYITVTAAS